MKPLHITFALELGAIIAVGVSGDAHTPGVLPPLLRATSPVLPGDVCVPAHLGGVRATLQSYGHDGRGRYGPEGLCECRTLPVNVYVNTNELQRYC